MRSKTVFLLAVVMSVLSLAATADSPKLHIFYADKPEGFKDATVVSGKANEITVNTAGKKIVIKTEDLIKMKFGEFQPLQDVERIVLVNGDILVGKLIQGDADGAAVKISFASKALGTVKLDMSQHVMYYCNQPAFKNAEDFKATDQQAATRSFFNRFVETDGRNDKSDFLLFYEPNLVPPRAQTIRFAISEVTATEIKGVSPVVGEMSVKRSNAPAFVVKKVDYKAPQTFHSVVRLADGGLVTGDLLGIDSEALELKPHIPFAASVKIKLTDIQEVDFRFGKTEYISDHTPVKADEHPFFSKVTHSWQKDRMAVITAGVYPPLIMDGTHYRKGIGVHSYSNLEYDLHGKYRRLIGLVGVDASGNQYSNFVAVIKVDGKEVFKKAIKWGDKPVAIDVDIKNALKLELIIDFGENLDVGDRADWANVILIKK